MSEEKTVRIVRHAAERDFTILRNEAIRDSALTWKATGQLCYLLSLPSDWRLRLSHLSKQKKDGRDSTRVGFKELEHAGYMWIEKLRDEKGKFVETVWHVSDMPAWRGRDGEEANAENPCAENPNAGNPTSGNPTLQSTQQRSTDENKNVNPHKERAEGQRPFGKRAKGPLSGGGVGSKYQMDNSTGVCLQAGNAQDLQALAEIKSHGQCEIEAAVAQARAAEPSGRAYPTAVLRSLRSLRRGRGAGGPAGAGAGAGAAPAWALAGAGAHASPREIDITDQGETL